MFRIAKQEKKFKFIKFVNRRVTGLCVRTQGCSKYNIQPHSIDGHLINDVQGIKSDYFHIHKKKETNNNIRAIELSDFLILS